MAQYRTKTAIEERLAQTDCFADAVHHLIGDFIGAFCTAGEDIVKVEQYADFVRNRMFRRSIICRKDVRLDRKSLLQRAESMWAIAFLRQWAEGGGMSRFEHPRGGRMVTGSAAVRDALVHIARQFPRPTQLGQILSSAAPGDRL